LLPAYSHELAYNDFQFGAGVLYMPWQNSRFAGVKISKHNSLPRPGVKNS
jgi:hypothetical protein